MSSIMTNPSAITALHSLRQTQHLLNVAQKEISTGLRNSSAMENAANWSIAETMKSDQRVLTTLGDSLNESASLLNVASAAVNSAIKVINDIKSSVAQAEQPGADLTKIGASLTQLSQQLKNLVSSSVFTGVNLLDGSGSGAVAFIASYIDNGGAAASVIGTIDLTTTTLVNTASPGSGILESAQATGSLITTDFTNLSASDIQSATVVDTLSNADKAISQLTTYAAQIGTVLSHVNAQAVFVTTLNDALTTGVSALVDADMNEVSTRLQALQTQQQLGVQSVSIANQDAQLIMKLFQ